MQGLRVLRLALMVVLAAPPTGCAAQSTGPLRLDEVWRLYDPVLVERVNPKYPRRARREGVEGQVIVQALIRVDGTVSDLVVLRSDTPGYGFEESALKAVRQWRYAAAVRNRRPVDVYSTIVIQFALDDPASPPSD